MKKHLFNIGLFLLAVNCMMAQQEKQTSVVAETVSTATEAHGHAIKNSKSVMPAPTTITSTCESLNYPAPSTWTLQSYRYSTGVGYVNGTNLAGDKERASYFDASASTFTLLNQVYVQFAVGKGANLSKPVAMIIYDGTSGSPGAALGTSSLTLGDIKADIAGGYYTSFVFSGGIPLPASKKFFASVDMSALTWSSTIKDSLNIVSNKDGQSVPPPTWEKQSDNTWHQYNTSGATTLSVSLVMFPFLTNTPSSATFSVSANPICVNQAITYDATGTAYDASNASNILQWTFLGPVATSTLQANMTPTRTLTTAGTYTTVLEVLSGGCSVYEYAIKTVTVNALPNVTSTPASTVVCSGTNITLTAGGTATTYTWTGGVTDGVSFTPTSTNYTVTGTAANGCTNTAVSSVTVNALPNVSVTPASTAVCVGTNITLTGSGASTYTWTGGVTNGVSFTPTSTNYTVTATDVNGCVNTAVASVTVNTLPSVSATPASTTVCAGTNITLTGGGATTYTWSGGVSDGVAFAPASTDYTVTGTDANGCVNTAVASVTVNSLPNVTATPASTVVCAGTNITLTAGGAATTYTWSNGVIDGAAFAPTSTDYTVTGTDANGCENSAIASVTVNSVPTVSANTTASVICSGENVTLSGAGATSYTWSAGVTDGTPFAPTGTDTYTVTGETNGCAGTATVEVTVSLCTGIATLSSSNAAILIYPNPNSGEFTIKAHHAETIVIVNELGQFIQTIELTQSNDFSYKVSNLQAGIYFLNGKTTKHKIVVTH